MTYTDKVNIYLIEDQEMYAMMLDQKLKNTLVDHTLQIFEKGEECLENVTENQPDIIIINYLLPDMNGLQLLKRIKKKNPNIPVVVISSQKDIQVTRDLLQAGAYDYIIKDKNTVPKLHNAIHKILEKSDLEEEVMTLRIRLNKNNFYLIALFIILVGIIISFIAMFLY